MNVQLDPLPGETGDSPVSKGSIRMSQYRYSHFIIILEEAAQKIKLQSQNLMSCNVIMPDQRRKGKLAYEETRGSWVKVHPT